MSDDKGFDTSTGFDLQEWLSLWSYEKIHAVGLGAGIAGLAAAFQSPALLAGWFGIIFWALGLRMSPRRQTRSGDKKDCDEDEEHAEEIAKRSRDGQSRGMSAQLLAEIRHKPHYFGAGGLIGDRLVYGAYVLFTNTEPDHYGEAWEMASTMLPFGM